VAEEEHWFFRVQRYRKLPRQHIRDSDATEELALHAYTLKIGKYNAEALRTRRKEMKEGDVKSPLRCRCRLKASTRIDEKNLWGLDIPEFGGLRSTQHADVDAGILSDQFVGISASQCRGIDLGGQQDRRCNVGAAFQTIFLESSGEIEQLPVMTTNTALPT